MPPTFRCRCTRSFGLSSTPGRPPLERADDGDADGQRQSCDKARPLLEPPAQRKRETAARDGGPDATAPAATCGLPFGRQQRAVDIAAAGAPQELARRGVDLVDHFDGDGGVQRNAGRAGRENDVLVVGSRQQWRFGIGWRDVELEVFERRPDGGGVEEIRCREQPVAAAPDALEREAGRFGSLAAGNAARVSPTVAARSSPEWKAPSESWRSNEKPRGVSTNPPERRKR
jgi:hypothetical protein